MNKIVVMGGSFNPPTIAHLHLMEAAVNSLDAVKGIFVPTSHAYVLRKMKRLRCPQDTLSASVRTAMLETFCARDSRFEVCRVQILKPEQKYDFEMLEGLQAEYPECGIYFLTGSDKLHIIPRWHRINEFIAKFKILVGRRGEDNLDLIKAANPFLAEHWESFVAFDVPDDIKEISSSAFRKKLRSNDTSAQDLVTPEVWEIMRNEGKIPSHTITDFHDEQYGFLSNFYEASVAYGGLTYGSTEAAFQAQKCMTEEEKAQFTECRPSKSKSLGRKVKLRPDWEEVKTGIMEEIVRAKFAQHPDLAERLLATGDKVLVEGNHWGDVFWGVDTRTGQGENHLGKILMKIRAELRRHD